MIIGSGGVLSHAPDRKAAALMLVDAFEPQGVTELCVDSIFMMPHLGVFSEAHEQAALDIFERDCLVFLGTAVCPIFSKVKPGDPLLEYKINNGKIKGTLRAGQLERIDLEEGKTVSIQAMPSSNTVDVGAGAGRSLEADVRGGNAGIILDGRGRPLTHASDAASQATESRKAMEVFDLEFP